jgi:dTDP-4-amino-4,6-dideoxygalactose transaminase
MKIDIPYFSFNKAPKSLTDEWKLEISNVIEQGQFIGGNTVELFEKNWADSIGTPFAVGVGNGLDGLAISLRVLEIGDGKTVAVPAHTFIASWLAVDMAGASPIGIDVDQNGLLDLDKLFSLEIKPDAVMPVHLHGAMVDMPRLSQWAKAYNIKIIEDASQAHFASIDLIKAGAWSDAGVFSLYPSKNLGAIGDAGVINFKNEKHATLAKSIRSYGSEPSNKYAHERPGVNSRLDAIQAAVLNVNLKYLSAWNANRVDLGKIYSENLDQRFQILQSEQLKSVRHHFPILVSDPVATGRYLLENGIGSERHYPEVAAYTFSRIKKKPQAIFPNAEKIAKCVISLPISQWHSIGEIETVCEILNKGLETGRISL